MIPNQFPYQLQFQFFALNADQNAQLTLQGFNYPFINELNFEFQRNFINSHFLNTNNYTQFRQPQVQNKETCREKGVEIKNQTLKLERQNTQQKKQIIRDQSCEGVHKEQTVLNGCICSKTGCVKEYCRCFKAGNACTDQCRCHHCKNLVKRQFPVFKKQKNSKWIKCNCKKSKCSNKYCDCLVAGQQCGPQCKCCECGNH